MVIYRAWTHTTAVNAARKFLAAPPPRRAATRRLMEEIASAEPAARKRATDLARLVSARQPGIFTEWTDLLIDILAELRADQTPETEWQSAGYLALAAAHNIVTPAQRTRLANLLRPMLTDQRTAIRATALEAFSRTAAPDPALRNEALAALEEALTSDKPATRNRARQMLTLLLQHSATKSESSRKVPIASRAKVSSKGKGPR